MEEWILGLMVNIQVFHHSDIPLIGKYITTITDRLVQYTAP